MSKRQMNVRVNEVTRRQVREIAKMQNMTEGEVVALGVERLCVQLETFEKLSALKESEQDSIDALLYDVGKALGLTEEQSEMLAR